MKVRRGQVVWARLEGSGSVQRGKRPCIVIQNEAGNKFSNTTIVVPLTSRKRDPSRLLPTHLRISKEELGKGFLDSVALCEQIRVIDKTRLMGTISYLNEETVKMLDIKVAISLGISNQEASATRAT